MLPYTKFLHQIEGTVQTFRACQPILLLSPRKLSRFASASEPALRSSGLRFCRVFRSVPINHCQQRCSVKRKNHPSRPATSTDSMPFAGSNGNPRLSRMAVTCNWASLSGSPPYLAACVPKSNTYDNTGSKTFKLLGVRGSFSGRYTKKLLFSGRILRRGGTGFHRFCLGFGSQRIEH